MLKIKNKVCVMQSMSYVCFDNINYRKDLKCDI